MNIKMENWMLIDKGNRALKHKWSYFFFFFFPGDTRREKLFPEKPMISEGAK